MEGMNHSSRISRIARRLAGAALGQAACAVILAGFCGGCASLPSVGLSGISVRQHAPFTIAQSERELGWGYYSHPLVYQYPDGDVLVRFFLHGDWKKPLVTNAFEAGTAVSRNLGRTWTVGAESLTPLQRFGPHYMGAVVRDGGQLKLFEGSNTLWVAAPTGEPGLRTNFAVRTPPRRSSIMYGKDAIREPDGGILLGAYTRFMTDKYWRCILLRSRDGGLSFDYVSTMMDAASITWSNDAKHGFEGPNEVSMAALPDGELVAVSRVGVRVKSPWLPHEGGFNLAMARSSDRGATWTVSRMKQNGVCPKLLLMSNGVLVLSFGRFGNNLSFSSDGGRSWSVETPLTSMNVKSSGYCDIVEVSPGRLLAVYDLYNTDLGGIWLWEPTTVNGVLGRFVDVAALW